MSGLEKNYKLLYSKAQIESRVHALGAQISDWAKKITTNGEPQPLAVCILRGGIYFFSDLLRAIDTSIEPTFCRAWGYQSDENLAMKKEIGINVDNIEANGRAVILVDDICDTGRTLTKLEQVFLGLGARAVTSAVLVRRIVKNQSYTPTWSAFDYDAPEWIVGCGAEDKNHNSNLPDIYAIV